MKSVAIAGGLASAFVIWVQSAHGADYGDAYRQPAFPQITLAQAKAILANYPKPDSSDEDYTARIGRCMNAPPATATAAASPPSSAAAPGLAGLVGGLMARQSAAANPAAMDCMRKAEDDTRAQTAGYNDAMAPEAKQLRDAVDTFEGCVRTTFRTRGVMVRGACDYGTITQGTDRRFVVPNRGLLYGGATHWASLVYTPGDENALETAK